MDKIRTIEVEVHEDMTATLSYEGKPENFPDCNVIAISEDFPETMVLLRPAYPVKGCASWFSESYIVLRVLLRHGDNELTTSPIVFFNVETHRGWLDRKARQVINRTIHSRDILREVELSIEGIQ